MCFYRDPGTGKGISDVKIVNADICWISNAYLPMIF
jgi:hypothetical protein